MKSENTIRVSVVGATGYAGQELAAILARHRGVALLSVYSSPGGSASGANGAAPFDLGDLLASSPDAVFLATPNEVSAELAPRLLDAAPGLRVIDLSGAFRLGSAADYPCWYGFAHPRPELLPEAVYGLTEWCNGSLSSARLVANPGCYPPSVLLALKPLLPLLDPEQPVVCDAMSGVTGAGKRSDLAYSFSELFGNFKAYGAGGHRHEPEMREQLELAPGAPFVFVPHLLPVARGILSTLHVALAKPATDAEISQRYAEAYAGRPFVEVLPAGELPDLATVVGTPRAAIGFIRRDEGKRAVVVSVLDNLLKGAASQAVQNFNRMFGLPEAEGLA